MEIQAQRTAFSQKDIEWIIARAHTILGSGNMAYNYGTWVKKFEDRVKDHLGVKHAVAMGSGTQALEVAIRALLILHEVVAVPANTYMATWYATWHAGCMPRVIESRMHIDLDHLKKAHNQCRLGAVIPVHIGGQIQEDIGELQDFCSDENIYIIEDACHALGSHRGEFTAGRIGEVACFSFYPTKLISCGGEGGMLVTDESDIAEYARRYRHDGRPAHKWDHVQMGHNYCMDEIRGLMGYNQMTHINKYIRTRQKVAEIYRDKFDIVDHPGCNHYKIITFKKLKPGPFVHLPSKVYDRPITQYDITEGPNDAVPWAELFCAAHGCLPVYNDMTEREAEFVVDTVEAKELI